MSKVRMLAAALSLSAAGLVGILTHEGFRGEAYLDTGGVPTIGYGTTEGVRMGDTITPAAALSRAARDVKRFEGAVRRCVKVPLYQHEYDVFLSLSYNIGEGAFCGSTLVRKLNGGDYAGACQELHRWVYDNKIKIPGLIRRRADEYRQCMGEGVP